MELAVQAYEGLFGKTPRKKMTIKYSGRFREYGANVSATFTTIEFRLSKEFLETSNEIQIGVMQYLLSKLYKSKKRTMEMDLYDSFLKNIGEWESASTKNIEDEELEESFNRVNERYFNNYMTAPHIKWGRESKSRLGYYAYATDTVTLSTILQGAGDILDYVMYHELLHKKHKYEVKGNRTHSHTPAFRRDERKFKMSDDSDPEKALHKYLVDIAKTRRRSKSFVERMLDF